MRSSTRSPRVSSVPDQLAVAPGSAGLPKRGSVAALAIAGFSALLASTCCVLPLVFVIVGVSGAWIGQLHQLEPYSYSLTALAAVSLALAGWDIWRPAAQDTMQCDAEICRTRKAAARRWFWVVMVLTLLPIVAREGAHFFY